MDSIMSSSSSKIAIQQEGFNVVLLNNPQSFPAFDIQNGLGPVTSYVPGGPSSQQLIPIESLSEQMQRSLSLGGNKQENPAYLRTLASHYTPSSQSMSTDRCACQRWY